MNDKKKYISIRVGMDALAVLIRNKVHPREPYNDVLLRLLRKAGEGI